MSNTHIEGAPLTLKEAAEYLKAPAKSVRGWVNQKSNPLPCFKANYRNWRFFKEDIDRWLGRGGAR